MAWLIASNQYALAESGQVSLQQPELIRSTVRKPIPFRG